MKRLINSRLIKIVMAAAIGCLFLAGCSVPLNKAGSANYATNSEIGKKTRTIYDMHGRKVEIPLEIRSVAAVGSSARMLTYAGCADKITAVTDMDKTNNINMPYSVVNAVKFAALPSVGSGGSKDISYVEEIVALLPDVIVSNRELNEIDKLQQKTGIPVIGLKYEGIFSEEVYAALTLLGDIFGTQDRCEALVLQMKRWQQDLHDRTKDIPDKDKPTVYAGGISYKGSRGFDGTYAKYPPFEAINAKNVVDETGYEGALIVDMEKVLEWDPDIIFLNPANMYIINEDYKKNSAFYDSLTAVKHKKLYSQISYNYNSTNIELAVANAYYAGKIIFPQQFKDIDIEEKADEIFEVMLGTKFYHKLIDAGLEFKNLSIGE